MTFPKTTASVTSAEAYFQKLITEGAEHAFLTSICVVCTVHLLLFIITFLRINQIGQ